MILILLHSFYLDSPKFSVMPDLIGHPENQLSEFNWISLKASLRVRPSTE
jgi:hypothetical protein